MIKKQFFRIGMVTAVLILFLCTVSYLRQQSAEPYICFNQEYVKENVPLTVTCNDYPRGTSFSYVWMVDDTVLDETSNTYVPSHEDLEHFITVRVIPDNGYSEETLQLYFSSLPVMYIDTEDGTSIYSKDFYFDATIHMQGNEQYNSQTTTLYDGPIYIKGRGNSTWHTEKLSYKVKLEQKADLFNMGTNKHWVLLANPFDDSLMRNKIAYDLSGELGMPYMESTWVDIILNGEYIGNYLFCEQIRISKDRVNITNLEDYAKNIAKNLSKSNMISADERDDFEDYLCCHMEWLTTGIIEYNGKTYDISSYFDLSNIDGGFLFELDAFFDEPSKFMVENQPIQIDRPKYIGTNDTLMTYAYNFVSAFYDAAYLSEDFYTIYNGTPTHYSELFDVDSLATYFLMTEIFFDEDSGLKSTYFYKDIGELAQMGPIWDMDYSSGGEGQLSYVYDQWQAVFYSNYSQDNQWYKGLIRDPYFLSKVLEKWDTYRDTIFHIIADDGPMEEAYAYIYDSALANDRLWTPEDSDEYGSERFINGYQVFKTWMTNHLNWLDGQFTTLEYLVDSVGAFDCGSGVSLIRDSSNTVTVSAEAGSYAVFYFNGLKQTELPLENGVVSWSFSSKLHSSESDVIQVRVYNDDHDEIGSDYVDFRK